MSKRTLARQGRPCAGRAKRARGGAFYPTLVLAPPLLAQGHADVGRTCELPRALPHPYIAGAKHTNHAHESSRGKRWCTADLALEGVGGAYRCPSSKGVSATVEAEADRPNRYYEATLFRQNQTPILPPPSLHFPPPPPKQKPPISAMGSIFESAAGRSTKTSGKASYTTPHPLSLRGARDRNSAEAGRSLSPRFFALTRASHRLRRDANRVSARSSRSLSSTFTNIGRFLGERP